MRKPNKRFFWILAVFLFSLANPPCFLFAQQTDSVPTDLSNQDWDEETDETLPDLSNQDWDEETDETSLDLSNQNWDEETEETIPDLSSQDWDEETDETASDLSNQDWDKAGNLEAKGPSIFALNLLGFGTFFFYLAGMFLTAFFTRKNHLLQNIPPELLILLHLLWPLQILLALMPYRKE